MSASDRCAIELSGEIDAAPSDPPIHNDFTELDTARDVRDGNNVMVFFDGDRIEYEAAFIRSSPDDVLDLMEER